MRKVDIHEATTTLPQLVDAVEAGETVVLARAGEPVVELVRLRAPGGVQLGVLKGMFSDEFLAAAVEPTARWPEA